MCTEKYAKLAATLLSNLNMCSGHLALGRNLLIFSISATVSA